MEDQKKKINEWKSHVCPLFFDFEYEKIDKGKPGKDLNQKEQKHLDSKGGPTNKSNPNGGTSNKKNVIKKTN